jgi:hypothetical protein
MLPPMLRALALRQNGLLTSGQAKQGGLTKQEVDNFCRQGLWLRILRGVYAVPLDGAEIRFDPQLWWRAALLAHGGRACLMATTGARAFGLVGLPQLATIVEIGCIGGISRHVRFASSLAKTLGVEPPQIVTRQLPLEQAQIVDVDGFPVREIGATLVDAALIVDRATVLCLLDSALHQELITDNELAALAVGTTNRRGVRVFREMAAIADGRAESQVESRVRLACIDGSVAPDDLQYVVQTPAGHPVAKGDLAWHKGRRRPLLAEADGKSVHSLPVPVYQDRRRGNLLVIEACDTLRFTFADAFRPNYIASTVKGALAA